MATTIAPENPVLIIGGGNCGLVIASGLEKAGIPYVVFERDSEEDFLNKTRDWGMLLHWGDQYLRRLVPESLRGRLREIEVDPHYVLDGKEERYPHFDAETGEIVRFAHMPVISRVSRKRLRQFLSKNQRLNVKYGKRLQAINLPSSTQVTVEFEDGTRETGSCVVGCDGSKSRVREYLLGADARPIDVDISMINHVAQYSAEQARFLRTAHPIVKLAFSPQGTALLAVLDASDKEHPENWKFQTYYSWRGPPFATDLHDPRGRLAFYKERLSKFCEPFRTAALALKDDEVVPVDPGQQWAPAGRWNNQDGRVTLAGDAAHSMLPHRGQGLNNAMKDASQIVDALTDAVHGRKSLAKAIDEYEEEMIPRGAAEVEVSNSLAEKRVDAKYEDAVVLMGLKQPQAAA